MADRPPLPPHRPVAPMTLDSSSSSYAATASNSALSSAAASTSWLASPWFIGVGAFTLGLGVSGFALWWRRRRARQRRAERDAAANVADTNLGAASASSAAAAAPAFATPAPSRPSASSSLIRARPAAPASSFLAPPTSISSRHPSHPLHSPSPRLIDMRPAEEGQEMSDTLLRAKAKKEAREERERMKAENGSSSSSSAASPLQRLKSPSASWHSASQSTSSPRVVPSNSTISSSSSSSMAQLSSPTRSSVADGDIHSVVHFTSPSAGQSLSLDTSPLLLTRRHGVELLCLLVVVLVILVLMQDARWLAPISPILLYSLFSVAHEPVSTDPSSIPPTPRRLLTNESNTQGLSLFGYSVRVPTPMREQRIVAIPPTSSSRAPLAPSSRTFTTSSSSSSSIPPPNVSLRSPQFLPSHSHSHRLTSSSLHTPLAIPFPSLATPAARSLLLADRERSFTPESESADEQSIITPIDQQTPTAFPSSIIIAPPAAVVITQPQPIPSAMSPIITVDSVRAQAKRPVDIDEHKEAETVPPISSSPPAATIAASILPRSNAQLHIRSRDTPASLIDVSATLARIGSQPASSSSLSQPSLGRQSSVEIVTTDGASHLSSSITYDSELNSSSIASSSPFFRADLASSLSPSQLQSSSFSIRFTFHHPFELVARAFLRFGMRTDEEETEGGSDYTPPLTPPMLTPNASAAQLNLLSPTSDRPTGGSVSSSSISGVGALFSLDELVVDVISDTMVEPSATTGSDASQPVRHVVRRVVTPIKLPQLIRKLLGHLTRMSMEERIIYDESGSSINIQLVNRDLSSFISIYSIQTLTPHPTNSGHTQWSCKYKLHAYNTCGPMRQNVSNWLSSMTKSRQQQISAFISAGVKKAIKMQIQFEAQQREEEEKNAAAAMAASSLTKRPMKRDRSIDALSATRR